MTKVKKPAGRSSSVQSGEASRKNYRSSSAPNILRASWPKKKNQNSGNTKTGQKTGKNTGHSPRTLPENNISWSRAVTPVSMLESQSTRDGQSVPGFLEQLGKVSQEEGQNERIHVPASGEANTPATEKQNERLSPFDQTSGKKELRPIRGSWQVSRSKQASGAAANPDNKTQPRITPSLIAGPGPQSATSGSISLETILNAPGQFHETRIESEKTASSPVSDLQPPAAPTNIPNQDSKPQDSKSMSYFPDDPVTTNGATDYPKLRSGLLRAAIVPVAIIVTGVTSLGALIGIEGTEGSTWNQTHLAMTNLVKSWISNENRVIPAQRNDDSDRNGDYGNTYASARRGPADLSQPFFVTQRKAPARTRRVRAAPPTAERRPLEAPAKYALVQTRKNARGPLAVAFPINLPQNAPADKLRIKISGVPSGISLTEGQYMSSGTWMVESNRLKKLKLKLHNRYKGNARLTVTAVKENGQTYGVRDFDLAVSNRGAVIMNSAGYAVADSGWNLNNRTKIANADSVIDTIPSAAPGRTAITTARIVNTNANQLSPSDLLPPAHRYKKSGNRPKRKQQTSGAPKRGRGYETVLMKRQIAQAAKYLQNSDVFKARSLLKRAAKAGSTRAAIALARTYDPKYLLQMEVSGILPNVTKAKYWYRQAAKKGNYAATRRLRQLGWKEDAF